MAGAFYGCKKLRSVTFAEEGALAEIRHEAFAKTGIEEIITPRSLKIIHAGAFKDCECLQKIILNEGLQNIGSNQFSCVYDIDNGAFKGSLIEEIELPSSL